MSYEDVKIILKDRGSKKIANNTYLYSHPDGIVMNLHGNRIATFTKEYIRLSSAYGWRTRTTKHRLNMALAMARVPNYVRIYQHDWVWYLGWYDPKYDAVLFDGIKVDYEGGIVGL